ncbi:glycosyltransferase [Limnofasciculus baicalensis]|uniref:Glycosyltransferase n=1 Tax=Limnofasciculus baicalensis BBK-W-15 TaxID=2699891 RepID=A0AAE3GW45_9CYAN|nr:glycosyltransferase [Limnofasciculus baicalensis]MCP2731514.1 glycosyltransferase [Limnofasciculus baicalensis BBK-W-15]
MTITSPRIAIYLRNLSGGGAERVMVSLSGGFIKKGIDVDLVLNKVEGAYLSQVPPEVRIVDLQAPKLPAGLPKLASYLRRERPSVLLSALHYTNEIAILAKYLSRISVRVVVSERNTLSLHGPSRNSDRLSPLLARLLYPWADGIVAVSQGVADDLAQVTGISPQQIETIYNPTVTANLLEKSQESLNHPWFKTGEPPVVLAVGRLDDQKDFPTLINAFAIVKKIQPCRLIILGQGPQKQKLEALVQELDLKNDVAMLGFAENPSAYMAKAAVFVLSSAWEGLPNALIEAMAIGIPVVSTNCPSGPREILDNGKYGSLVPVGDSKAMADAILSVLSGKFSSVDPTWLKQFTLEVATQKYLEVLGFAKV